MLLGVRGNLTFPDRTQQSWLFADRSRHSVKPAVFRKLIEQVSPGPRLELFARAEADGWTTWGAEFTVREWCRLGRVKAEKKKCGRGISSEWIISHEELMRVRNEGLLPDPHPYRHVH